MKRLTVLAVIPARGGSKGIPYKNIIPLGGKPLLRWTIDAARNSRLLTHVLLSTDSPRIRRLGQRWGCPAPFLRPKALATDHAKTLDVIRHAVSWHEQATGQKIDAVMALQPTAPFRTSQDIDAAIRLLAHSPHADSVVSFQPVGAAHPNYLYVPHGPWVMPFLGKRAKIQPRQVFSPVYIRNGAIYLARRATLMEQHSVIGRRVRPYMMPSERSVNIDERADLYLAEGLLRAQR